MRRLKVFAFVFYEMTEFSACAIYEVMFEFFEWCGQTMLKKQYDTIIKSV